MRVFKKYTINSIYLSPDRRDLYQAKFLGRPNSAEEESSNAARQAQNASGK